MLRQSLARRWAPALLTALLLLSLSGASTAAAKTTGDLERQFKDQVGQLTDIDGRLAAAEAYNVEAARVIARLRADGYNTEDLDNAYADLQVHLQNIRVELKAGHALAASRPGFDARGRVVEKGLAGKTVGDMTTRIKGIHDWGGDIYADMHSQFEAFKRLNGKVYEEPVRPTSRSLF